MPASGATDLIAGDSSTCWATLRLRDDRSPRDLVGYAIEDGPDGYTSFGDSDDLTGRIAVMLYEPFERGRLQPLE